MAGEAVAVSYLRSKGYRILERNYRYRKAEIDILALQQDCLAVVEVKTRTEDFYEALSASISKPKIKRLVIAADHFVRERKLEVAVRFDIIQLKKKSAGYQLTHIKNAFYHF
ncbi:MAG: YraN family protein [Robiginitalea sp.]